MATQLPPLSAAVLARLACPACRGPLAQHDPASIVCTLCARAYPVRDGIAVLIAVAPLP